MEMVGVEREEGQGVLVVKADGVLGIEDAVGARALREASEEKGPEARGWQADKEEHARKDCVRVYAFPQCPGTSSMAGPKASKSSGSMGRGSIT